MSPICPNCNHELSYINRVNFVHHIGFKRSITTLGWICYQCNYGNKELELYEASAKRKMLQDLKTLVGDGNDLAY